MRPMHALYFHMREVDLRKADLNLLVVLEALLDERTSPGPQAARHEPARREPGAGALARAVPDALLVDGPGGYLLTARAEEMWPLLRGRWPG